MIAADLFSYPHAAGAREETTSRAAAVAIEDSGRAATLRSAVLDWYRDGHSGTADECAAAMAENHLAIRPRVSELHKQGLLRQSGKRRRSAAGGGMAHVWEYDEK